MDSVSRELSASLIAETNDLSLVIDGDGVIRDVAIGHKDPYLKEAKAWIGKAWIDTVTVESRPKIKALLSAKLDHDRASSRWRQVNHPVPDQPDLPVMYKTMRMPESGVLVAVGRDLRQVSQLQQRLLDAQHSLERDYARLHQTEIRYRMLFSMASEAILFVDADSRKIVEANPAAGTALGAAANKLINRSFPRGFGDNSNDAINDLLLRVRAAGRAEAIVVRSANDDRTFRLNATLLRRDEGPYFLIRLNSASDRADASIAHQLVDLVNRSPDGFVITDTAGVVLGANGAFLDMCAIAAELQMTNRPLDTWLGRPGVDVNLLIRNLRERTEVRQFVTTLVPEFGEPFDIELSAVSALDSDQPCFGFIVRRQLNRRIRSSPEADDVLPRSLQEMTELVGRVPLKDLVRETTDIIERLCIEAALKMTDGSRASAAELLGLSRQSLYVKLNRFDIGSDEES